MTLIAVRDVKLNDTALLLR
ncbi:hypothetical protein FG05_35038 [Fusarium graminearum]|nr:hypothetical protein FG05_35038 [Fusarium graminearum]